MEEKKFYYCKNVSVYKTENNSTFMLKVSLIAGDFNVQHFISISDGAAIALIDSLNKFDNIVKENKENGK